MSQKILLPLGIDDFQKVILEGYYFVDKSLLIADIINDGAQVILLPRPRRFGKTLNLSMLYYYFSKEQNNSNRSLFDNLAIARAGAEYTRHQGQYPVIFFSLKDVKDLSYKQAYESIAFLIADLYKTHRYLLESSQLKQDEKEVFYQIMTESATEAHVKNSLKILITYLYFHYGVKPILLLDEYDSPLHTAYDRDYYEEMASFMQALLGGALKGNAYLQKAVITGILRVAQASIFSGLNNITVYSVLKAPYSQYFGFLEEEVKALCEKKGVFNAMNEVRHWYNGYQFGAARVYNPWSILNFLHFQGPAQPYWVNVANNSLIKKLVAQGKVATKTQFESLLQGQSIKRIVKEELAFPELLENDNALWNLLLFAGYLTLSCSEPLAYPYEAPLRIPNKEVQYIFEEMVHLWFSTRELDQQNYDQLLRSLVQHDITAFARLLQAYIRESGSYFDFNQHTPEQVYHALVLGLVVGLRDQFYIQSNRESGDGRFDVCLLPKQADRVGILLEFKKTETTHQLAQTAAEALQQITDRQYDTLFRQHHVRQVLCLGVGFSAREVKIESMMQEL